VPDSDLFGFRARARALSDDDALSRCILMPRFSSGNRPEWIPRSLRRFRTGLKVGIKAERFDGAFFLCGIGLTIPREQSRRRLSRFRDATFRHSSATSDAPQSRASESATAESGEERLFPLISESLWHSDWNQ